jgi:alpha-L-rhamnosidase
MVIGVALFYWLSTEAMAQVPVRDLLREFRDPPAEAKPMMRWWWFGPAVTRQELQKELETMHRVGIGGVEIQPVYPLMLDGEAKGIKNLRYLSPAFLDILTSVNKTARSLDMRVDITLGSGWPYGGPKTTIALSAGRLKVVSIPLTAATVRPPQLKEGESFIAAFSVSGTEANFDPASAERIDLSAAPIPSGYGNRTALFLIASHTLQTVKRPAVGAEGYVLDHFSRAAIDEHLTEVAAPLVDAFGDQPPYSVFSDSLEVYGSDWTANLPAEFQRRRGYDLIPHLPELLAGGTPEADAVRHDWGETLSDLIRENYLAPITSFAERHHTRFRSQTYGEPAVTLADEATANLPEGEGPQWRAFSFTRWASSASHLYGRNVTSAETWTWLHSPAFRATPLDMKAEADRMFLLGVNQIVGHGYPYSPPAAGEPGWSLYAAAVFNSHNPWFPVMAEITRYLQRVSWLLRQGEPANDIAILLPEDDAQAAFRPGHVSITDEMKRLITPELMSTILDAGYNVDYIDAATIDKLDKIPYPVLILPAIHRIPLATYRKIEDYVDTTGRAIAVGDLPSLAPGLKEQGTSAEIKALSDDLFRSGNHRGIVVDSIAKLPEALHQALPQDVVARGRTTGLGFIHRNLADSDIYFVANTSNQPIDGTIQFRSSRRELEAWDIDTGDVMARTELSGEYPTQLQLAPYESRVFILHDGSGIESTAPVSFGSQMASDTEKEIADLSTGWQLRFAGTAQLHFVGGLTSWTELPGKQFYSGEVTYSRSFAINHTLAPGTRILADFGRGTPTADLRPADAPGMRALLDPPIREAAIVYLNGQRAGSLWHPPYRLDITKLIHLGNNRIDVHVYNTAINRLAGQPSHDFTALNQKYGKRFEPQDMNNLEPIPSGLLGPIHVVEQVTR